MLLATAGKTPEPMIITCTIIYATKMKSYQKKTPPTRVTATAIRNLRSKKKLG